MFSLPVDRRIENLSKLRDFAHDFLNSFEGSVTMGISGPLGAGKTTFVRACVEELALRGGGRAPRVASPSFVLRQSYPDLVRPVDHFDLYRLEKVTEESLIELGYYEAQELSFFMNGFFFVEWPEQATDMSLLNLEYSMSIENLGDTCRRFHVKKL